MSKPNSLHGRVALITGGSREIGRAITLELASRGVDIVVNYLRHRQAAEETCAEVERQGARAYPMKANEALTRYLAVELVAPNMIVNAVSPGVDETEALNFFPYKDQIISHSQDRTPIGRLVELEDVAKLVAFLCSDDARMIGGQTITIDGGYSVLA